MKKEKSCKVQIGSLPSFFQENTCFFANILSIFFENVYLRAILSKEIGTLSSYGGRLIPILNLLYQGGANLLFLEEPPVSVLLKYFQDVLHLSLPQIKILPHRKYLSYARNYNRSDNFIKFLKNSSPQTINGYVSDRALFMLAKLSGKRLTSSLKGSRRGNNKYFLYKHILAEGFPSFDTYTAKDHTGIIKAFHNLQRQGYSKIVVKSQLGASGIGMMRITSTKEVLRVPRSFFKEGRVLVQGWLDESVEEVKYIGSPSVQIFVKENSVAIYDITAQLLFDNAVHQGNLTPAPYLEGRGDLVKEIIRQAISASLWLNRQGYRGPASIDFHIIERQGRFEVRISEINARVTGATYPSVLARYFTPQKPWLMKNISFYKKVSPLFVMKVLDRHNLLFFPGRKKGILPFNFNFSSKGILIKGQFLFLAPAVDGLYSLLNKLTSLKELPVKFDRD